MTDAPAAEEKPKTVEEQIDALFAPWNRSDAPGMSVGVVKDGQTVFRRGYGMASLETRVAIGPTTRLRIGSTSKHFTALLALLLQEDGKLDLDAPIRTYVPELTGPGGEPSARQLLQHRGGSRCYLDVGFVMHGMRTAPLGEALRVQARQVGRNFATGEGMIYNNGGYHMVSIAIERVGGAPFEEQLKTRLFDPVGMPDTISLPSDQIILPGMAAMHVPSPSGGWRRGLFPSEEVRGEGAIVSTIDDMLRWTAHLRTRDKFGTKETWRQLTELPTYADGSKGGYALGLMFEDYRGLPTMHHAGGVIGGTAQMLTFPKHGLDVVVLVNGAPAANPIRLAEQVADVVLADQVAPEAENLDPKAHEDMLGRWWSRETGMTYDFIDELGELKIALCGMPMGQRLRKAGDGKFVSPPSSIGEITVDASGAKDGSIEVRFGGSTASYRKIEKTEKLDDAFAKSIEGRYLSADGGGAAVIRREDDKLMVRFSDDSGVLDVELTPFAGVDAAGTATMRPDAMHFTVLNFDRTGGEAKGFRINSMRTRGLDFEAGLSMRLFVAALATETNTFAPFPTGRSGFEEYGITRHGSAMSGPLSGPLKVFRERAEHDGHEIIESVSAFAQPSGRTVCAVYEELRDTILNDLRAAGPVDIVFLMLHGAMVAQDYDDCEGDIIARARAIAPKATIGVEIDPHCHLTAAMVEGADLIVIAREYPHIDFDTRAHDLYDLCLRTARGEIRPVAALVDCRMIGFYPTFDEPMKTVVDRIRAASGQGGVLSVELGHGFPWGDVEDVGTRVLVYTDADLALAAGEAERHAREIYDQRRDLALIFPDVGTSLDRARGLNGRTVLGDFADNAGGGAPGDATFFLKALLDRGVDDAVIGAFWDPQMAQVCIDAGVGAILPLRIGGKCGPTSGDAVDVTAEVMGVSENHSQGVFGQRTPLGRSAWVRAGGIDIVICSVRSQVFEPDAFTGLGVPMDNRKLVIVKSSNHYRAGFDGISDNLWHVASPGCMSLDFPRVPYSKLSQPIFPMSADPWAEIGGPKVQLFDGAR